MSLKARLDAAFNQFTVAKRAEETTRALNDYSNQPKEIHSHFTELVDRIFTSSGWGMHDLTLQNKKDFEAIMTFLGPTGVFLNVINKLQLDPFLRYTMPAIVSTFYWSNQRLPAGYQKLQAVTSGYQPVNKLYETSKLYSVNPQLLQRQLFISCGS